MSSQIKKTRNKAITVSAVLAALGITSQANAQSASDYVDANSIKGAQSVKTLSDGSVEITFENGDVVRVAAEDVVIRNGRIFISQDALETLAEAGELDGAAGLGVNTALLVAGGVAAVGAGVGIGLSSGDDFDPNEPTLENDSIQGDAAANSINGLAGDDLIDGLGGDDTLDGGLGADTLIGGEGDDTFISDGLDDIDGGVGVDTVDFSSLSNGINVDLDLNTPQPGPAGQDGAVLDAPAPAGGQPVQELDDIENVIGTQGNDVLFGNNEANLLDGQGGDDLIHSFGGADTLIGGAGIDTALFSAGPGVIVDLDDNGNAQAFINNEEQTAIDTLTGFENLNGSNNVMSPNGGNDILSGNSGANVINGQAGDDQLFGEGGADTLNGGEGDDFVQGGGGADVTDGGEGIDTVSFADIGAPVTVDLAAETAEYLAPSGATIVDTVTNFENVLGSDNDDIISGDDVDNVLNGALGNDVLTGGIGNDVLNGGEGFDTADFSDIDVPVTVSLDAMGNGTATRDTGFTIEVVDAVVNGDEFGAGLNPETFVSEAVAGNIYFNIHTAEFPGGEIRGQLAVTEDARDEDGVGTITLSALLDGAQEPGPLSDSEATGEAVVTITVAADGSVTYSSTLEVSGIAPSELISLGAVSAIHLHNAPVGVNGPVVQDFIVDAGNPSGPALPFSVAQPISETDTLTSIENIIGSDDGDVILTAGPVSNTILAGEGDDFVQAGGGSDITDGGEGIDTVSFADIGAPVTVDLTAETAEYIAPSGATIVDTVTNFENVVGSDNDDIIIGDEGDNVLTGGLGNDDLNGGLGFDTADFSDLDVPVVVTLDGNGDGASIRETGFTIEVVDAVVNGDEFGAGLNPETFVSEAVAGNIYFNIHTADFNGGEIRGQLSVLEDARDADGVGTITLTGDLDAAQEPGPLSDSEATGFATVTITVAEDGSVTYSSELEVSGLAESDLISLGAVSAIHLHNAPAGQNGPVVQDFIVDAGNPSGPALPFTVAEPIVESDLLTSIENVIGSDDGDIIITSGPVSNTILAGGGDDVVQAGGGSDITDGGEGIDTVSFADIGAPVTVDLAAETAQYVAPSGAQIVDTVTNFENVIGSENDDVLAGDEGDNELTGNLGADTFVATAGDDVITDFVPGEDVLDASLFNLSQEDAFALAVDNMEGDAVITFETGDTLTFEGVSSAQLQGVMAAAPVMMAPAPMAVMVEAMADEMMEDADEAPVFADLTDDVMEEEMMAEDDLNSDLEALFEELEAIEDEVSGIADESEEAPQPPVSDIA